MAIISYYGEREIRVEDLGKSILQISLKHRIPHIRECGGKGRCTTCRIRVIEGLENVLPRNSVLIIYRARVQLQQLAWGTK